MRRTRTTRGRTRTRDKNFFVGGELGCGGSHTFKVIVVKKEMQKISAKDQYAW
jgi:hypothetical protein